MLLRSIRESATILCNELYLLIRVNYPCNFNEALSAIDSNSLLFEKRASNKRRKRKLILAKINMTMSMNCILF